MQDNEKFRMIPEFKVDVKVQILTESKNYNHELMNVPTMWKLTEGAGIKLAILDTGVPKHVDLNPSGAGSVIPGYQEDKNGHATHCAGIIAAMAHNGIGVAGIAPDVEDCYCAVLDESGSGSISNIVKGIDWAIGIGADVISMSLGIPGDAVIGTSLEDACNRAWKAGIAIFAATGNDAAWSVSQPARYDSVIGVGAVDSASHIADFSNMGPEVDFVAGGVKVYSTYLGNSYAKLSGTSMACPALAAVGALILAKHKKEGVKLSPDELYEHIKKIAFDVGPTGYDEGFGHGIPVFGSMADPEPPKDAPTPPDEDQLGTKKGPQADCAYWRLWDNFAQTVATQLKGDRRPTKEMRLIDALTQGLLAVAQQTAAITKTLRSKE